MSRSDWPKFNFRFSARIRSTNLSQSATLLLRSSAVLQRRCLLPFYRTFSSSATVLCLCFLFDRGRPSGCSNTSKVNARSVAGHRLLRLLRFKIAFSLNRQYRRLCREGGTLRTHRTGRRRMNKWIKWESNKPVGANKNGSCDIPECVVSWEIWHALAIIGMPCGVADFTLRLFCC